ncbi:hypothetical protein ACJIZ3_021353 [Penstemon smallii]|uniref:Disease resistance protein RPM1-like n=1 Tax=Penstemon smallii TaxID=265156 RepID=A0ABD3SL55_9LAMI
MAESAVSFLCNQLSIWLQQEGELLGGLKQEVQHIRDEMMQMKAFLRVADSKEENNPQLKEWVRQVREIAYDTEDVLDEYMFRFALRGATGFRGHIKKYYYTVKNLKSHHRIASEIQTIKHRLKNVSNTQQRYKVMGGVNDEASSSTLIKDTRYDGRGDALLLEEADVVGIEKPKKKLIDWLLPTDQLGLKVISVVGMGGLGKTTLVKKVYDDASLKSNFDHHVWITVLESFKVEHLLGNIIRQLVDEVQKPPPQGLEAMNDHEMREYIYKFLQHKNYIIVLDDVWQIHVWEAMRYAFPRSNTCGCIVITTRYSNIGNAACSENNHYVYELDPFPKEESKVLFYKKAFLGNSCPLQLKEICERILNICAGLPLAIVLIGGLLATKNNKMEEWELFSRSLADEFEGDNLKRKMKILSLSYYDLPYYLNSCFLYLSSFPEDETIGVERIIQIWIAEGLVQQKQGKTMEELSKTYVRELLDRSLIKLHETFSDGSPSTFRIHDLVREYIISKSKEQNVVAIFTGGGEMLWPDKIRLLALHTSVNYTQEEYDNLKYIRSLLWLGSEYAIEFTQILENVLVGGRLLKVLELKRAPINTIPSKVFKCYLLKHLNLSNTAVRHIPKSIKNLQNLECLNLSKTNVTELPIEILKLRKLRHLLAYKYGDYLTFFYNIRGFKAPYEIGSFLLSLETLHFINADEVGDIKIVLEIGKLTQLRVLGITNPKREDGKELCSSISKLINIHKLGIYSVEEEVPQWMDLDYSLQSHNSTLPFLCSLHLHGRIEKVPQWINPNSLHGLAKLSLYWSRLKEDPLVCLDDLPNLVELEMLDAYEGEGLSFKAKGFQRIQKLELSDFKEMKWMRVEKGSMPILENLSIYEMKLMVEVPEGIEHLTNLQEVRFYDMSKEFLVNLQGQKSREGKDWKLSHVPKVSAALKHSDGNYRYCPEFVQADS